MYNSRTNPTNPVFESIILISIGAGKSHKKPHHPSKVQAMHCLTAKACGRWLPLLSITLQGCTSFRHLSFHSVHCQPPASATHARVLPFIPFRSGQPSVPFRSPLAFLPTTRNSKPKWEAPFHPPQIATLHSVITLAFPHANQRYVLRSVHP
ncbi:MAG: hypothetical protein Q8S54_08175 [Bacteroidota bacterium]|nr:hypothetical protein [Bacteroidota bacterium]